jgi:hypothetical protein
VGLLNMLREPYDRRESIGQQVDKIDRRLATDRLFLVALAVGQAATLALCVALLLSGCGGEHPAVVSEDGGSCVPVLPSLPTGPCMADADCDTGAPCASATCAQGTCHAALAADGTACTECGPGLCTLGVCEATP